MYWANCYRHGLELSPLLNLALRKQPVLVELALVILADGTGGFEL